MADSTATLIGNLARDPELRYTNGGQAITSFGMAVNRRWQDKQSQEWKEEVSFFDVKAWGTLGENISGSLTKGMRIIVTGRLTQESWEQDDGVKRSKIVMVADSVGPDLRWATCAVSKNERTEGGGGNQQAARPAAAKAEPVKNPYADEEPF